MEKFAEGPDNLAGRINADIQKLSDTTTLWMQNVQQHLDKVTTDVTNFELVTSGFKDGYRLASGDKEIDEQVKEMVLTLREFQRGLMTVNQREIRLACEKYGKEMRDCLNVLKSHMKDVLTIRKSLSSLCMNLAEEYNLIPDDRFGEWAHEDVNVSIFDYVPNESFARFDAIEENIKLVLDEPSRSQETVTKGCLSLVVSKKVSELVKKYLPKEKAERFKTFDLKRFSEEMFPKKTPAKEDPKKDPKGKDPKEVPEKEPEIAPNEPEDVVSSHVEPENVEPEPSKKTPRKKVSKNVATPRKPAAKKQKLEEGSKEGEDDDDENPAEEDEEEGKRRKLRSSKPKMETPKKPAVAGPSKVKGERSIELKMQERQFIEDAKEGTTVGQQFFIQEEPTHAAPLSEDAKVRAEQVKFFGKFDFKHLQNLVSVGNVKVLQKGGKMETYSVKAEILQKDKYPVPVPGFRKEKYECVEPDCDRESSGHGMLRYHVQIDHKERLLKIFGPNKDTSRKPEVCQYCGKIFPLSKTDEKEVANCRLSHIFITPPTGSYCITCAMGREKEKDEDGNEIENGKYIVRCFTSKALLQEHHNQNHGLDHWACPICDEKTSSESGTRTHKLNCIDAALEMGIRGNGTTVLEEDQGKDFTKIWKCKECKESFQTYHKKVKHFVKKHEDKM